MPNTKIDPTPSAHLVMDYQHFTVGRLPDADALMTQARSTIDVLRDHGATIGYVRVAFAEGERPGGSMGRRVTQEQLAMLHVDAPGAQIPDEVQPLDGDIVVRKVRVGRSAPPISTNNCRPGDRNADPGRGVDFGSGALGRTSRFDLDYRLIVLSDLTFDPEPEIHDFLINRIFPKQAEVITSIDLTELLGSGS
jgi:nicotinamidase-related amidase